MPIRKAMRETALCMRYSQEIANDIRGLARYIGSLDEGRSKVSVNSTLSVDVQTF